MTPEQKKKDKREKDEARKRKNDAREVAEKNGLLVNQIWVWVSKTLTNAYAGIGAKTWANSLDNKVKPDVCSGDRFIVITTTNADPMKRFVFTGWVLGSQKRETVDDIWPEIWKNPIDILPHKSGHVSSQDLRKIFGSKWSTDLTLKYSHAPVKISRKELETLENLLSKI